MADRLAVESVDREGQTVVFRFRPQTRLDPERLLAIVGRRADVTLIPPGGPSPRSARGAGAWAPFRAAGPAILPGWRYPSRAAVSGTSNAAARRKGRPADSAAPPSWWTARATTGAVEPGFTKAEILKPAAEDPRAEHGVFTLVGRLLSDLLG